MGSEVAGFGYQNVVKGWYFLLLMCSNGVSEVRVKQELHYPVSERVACLPTALTTVTFTLTARVKRVFVTD